MRVAKYVANFIASFSPRVYGVCGAGAMHLNDAIAHHPDIKVIATHHEQAAAMAAEADARVTNKISVLMVTAGPGATNAMTGVACAWVDSIPMMVIAGQVTSYTMAGSTGLRQLGMNELDNTDLMRPITKYSATIKEASKVKQELFKALRIATTGRKGPVFVEIPLDVQAAEMNDKEALFQLDGEKNNQELVKSKQKAVYRLLKEAKRPVLLIGNGVRLADACEELHEAIGKLQVPVVSSWGAIDIFSHSDPFYIGRCGLFGDRGGNFSVQNADLVLAIGTRLSVAQIGHTGKLFAPQARKIVVDIDSDEIFNKPTVDVDLGIALDAKEFLTDFEPVAHKHHQDWYWRCKDFAHKYSVLGFDNKWVPGDGINAYRFADQLSLHLRRNCIVVTDVGFSFIPMMQALRLDGTQRLIHSAGVSPMGWGIPAAIGAAFTAPARQVICLTGDGGTMMNLQELQTIAHHNLPIKIFLFENGGYATMKIAQNNHFARETMAGERSGLSMPDFFDIARAFGIRSQEFSSHRALELVWTELMAAPGPTVIVLHMTPDQLIAPRVQARTENGKFLPVSIDDMWPHLPKEELQINS